MPAEGHREIAVEPARGVDVDRQGEDVRAVSSSRCRRSRPAALDAGRRFAVPVHPQNQVAIASGVHRDPDVLNRPRAVHVHERGDRLPGQRDARTHLPASAQVRAQDWRPSHFCPILTTSGLWVRRHLGHPATAFLAVDVLRGNRAALRVGQIRDSKQTIEHLPYPLVPR